MQVVSSAFDRLGRSLEASALRHEVIVNNIANVDTPKFKRSTVRFEDLLKQELNGFKSSFKGNRTDARHLDIGSMTKPATAQIVQDQSTMMNNNENNVDIDYEMSIMAKNQLYYNTLIGQVNHEIKLTRAAIDKR
jgi:flagellar basal-body rod protein FlgB